MQGTVGRSFEYLIISPFFSFQSQEISAKEAHETELVEKLDHSSRKLESVNQDLEAGKARLEAVEAQLSEQNRQLDSALSDRQESLNYQETRLGSKNLKIPTYRI